MKFVQIELLPKNNDFSLATHDGAIELALICNLPLDRIVLIKELYSNQEQF